MTENLAIKTKQRMMTPEQRVKLMSVTKTGLDWAAGKTSIEDVLSQLGTKNPVKGYDGEVSYVFGFNDFAASFSWKAEREAARDGRTREFSLQFDSDLITNTSREYLENELGLERVQQGELIDGIRKETLRYFNPPTPPFVGAINIVGFNLRKPLPKDSLFEVYVSFDYLRMPDTYGQSTYESTTNLRSIEITRSYLTPEELEHRNYEKRQRYNGLGLCTDMTCPETGYWDAWSHNGLLDVELVQKGDRFSNARNPAAVIRDGAQYSVPVKWFWFCQEDQKELAGERMVPLRRLQM